jgi:hypothetical protein
LVVSLKLVHLLCIHWVGLWFREWFDEVWYLIEHKILQKGDQRLVSSWTWPIDLFMFRIKLKKKLNKRLMIGTITRETKREGQRKAKRWKACWNQKKGRKLVPLLVRSYFTHNPFNVACMQISNGRFGTCITHQCNLPFYNKG